MKMTIAFVAFMALVPQVDAQTVGYKPWYSDAFDEVRYKENLGPIVGVMPDFSEVGELWAASDMLQFADDEDIFWCNFTDRRHIDAARKAEDDLLLALKTEGI